MGSGETAGILLVRDAQMICKAAQPFSDHRL